MTHEQAHPAEARASEAEEDTWVESCRASRIQSGGKVEVAGVPGRGPSSAGHPPRRGCACPAQDRVKQEVTMGTGERRAAVSPGLLGTGPQHWTSSYSSRQLPPGSMLWSVGRGSPRQGDGAGRTLPPQWCRFRDAVQGWGRRDARGSAAVRSFLARSLG